MAPNSRPSLLRYLFPSCTIRERYRERLFRFRYELVPLFKNRLQSRIYRYIIDSQRRRRDQSRLIDRGRRLLFGKNSTLPPLRTARSKTSTSATGKTMSSYGGYGYDSDGSERGARRKKLAAMAGKFYRAGAAAASEIKEQYNNTRIRNVEPFDPSLINIPRAFPHVEIVHNGEEQMVLFPCYAKRHVRQFGSGGSGNGGQTRGTYNNSDGVSYGEGQGDNGTGSLNDSEYWRHEWAKAEDEKAIVDVDVRGWIYMPNRGPMSTKNRMLIGLARRMTAIPAPTVSRNDQPTVGNSSEEQEERRIAKEAQEIERRGHVEKEVAARGGYNEPPGDHEDFGRNATQRSTRSRTASPPDSPTVIARPSFAASELSDSEVASANANMMARLAPFLAIPMVNIPITIFYYNEEQSQSRTVETNDSGHFMVRAALDFVPTHVRVLVSQDISATQPVQIVEPVGVSLISDIDDTIKRSSISLGAREVFRNTFIRDLGDLTIDGVKEWYNSLHKMGVKVHYVSNSPWQLYPVLATYLHTAGLPHGSLHLKQYSGMLAGIFEPVAERKKGTLEKILTDFPERRFLLVGDSGEVDLEVYTEVALNHPGRVLGIFIRDVTTPELSGHNSSGPKFFDSGYGLDSGKPSRQGSGSGGRVTFGDEQQRQQQRSGTRPAPPDRIFSAPAQQQQQQQGHSMGTLIDLSDEPEDISPADSSRKSSSALGASSSAVDLLAGSGLGGAAAAKKPPPPRPAKPKALRSSPSDLGLRDNSTPNLARTDSGASQHPLAQTQSRDLPTRSNSGTPPPPPPRRRTGTPSSTTSSQGQQQAQSQGPPPPPQRRTTNLNASSSNPATKAANKDRATNPGATQEEFSNPLDDIGATVLTGHGMTATSGGGNGMTSGLDDKKIELWHRRLTRAHELLDQVGVPLYTWRRGDDVIREAEGIVRRELEENLRKKNRG
ncbi:hypothetical protein QBC37DRAFT_475099 [Rhypophila decipiens]|uniref:Phosphatidate phosphatase APP1 catalytic domain-containing protein n=1 Tax=Rhypophila decipiens TaxID=261697 RepID=A0AAN7B517_9PEZI|nr:hypothetical protein QBC37DRAFT_475099 [Rhypophila decipiens]